MSNLSEKLQLRRQTLLAKSQAERILLTQYVKETRQSLSLADLGLQIVDRIRARPVIGLALLVTTFIVKPRRMLALAKTAVVAWKIWSGIVPKLRQKQRREIGLPDEHD